eukprot:366087-Chlamydomonas_euryale.AAC.11
MSASSSQSAAAAESKAAESAEAGARLAKEKSELSKKLTSAQDYIQSMLNERSDIEKKFHSMKDDLLTRLQNACGQRDDARGQVLELQAQMEALREQLVGQQRFTAAAAATSPAVATAAAAAATASSPGGQGAPLVSDGMAGSPHLAANGVDGGVPAAGPLGSFAQSLTAKSSGYARAISDGMATLGFGAQPLGTPPPVALQPVGPETEADRKMREMQVSAGRRSRGGQARAGVRGAGRRGQACEGRAGAGRRARGRQACVGHGSQRCARGTCTCVLHDV